MAKASSKTVKVGRTTVKGATDADKQNISAAKASVKADEARTTTTRTDETPEAKATTTEQKAAARETFAKGDARVQPDEPASRIAAREAAKLSPEKLAEAQATNAASLAARGW